MQLGSSASAESADKRAPGLQTGVPDLFSGFHLPFRLLRIIRSGNLSQNFLKIKVNFDAPGIRSGFFRVESLFVKL